jgi:ABC-type multidrug transport system fused ATPase/permease subunit
VLEGVDLVAPVGTITAIVGPTGSGKSTLVALLLRLFDPEQGSIEIDGRDLRGFRVASVRANVSIALQENVLFGTTVRENIRYAMPDAGDEAVRQAARVACADEFIRELPDGYDTLLGERGTKLSTGQRQRLSIARALLKDASVLVLDEPTAALDAETELRVLRNLHEWGRGRAIFLITHRLSTIRRADQIAVMAQGRVAELGSHDELIAREGGLYRSLVESEEVRAEPLEVAL